MVDLNGNRSNHILFDQCFLLARNMAPGRVSAEDIIEFTLDGEAVNANGRKVYLERFIHGEIYRKRPDVKAVVHAIRIRSCR
jgi:HCOMODA/2-hydroxy-3-carboxy-muconic semialdehyde decarboxylase